MKTLSLLVVSCALLLAAGLLQASPESEKAKKVATYLRQGQDNLKTVLQSMRAKVDQKLVDVFPHLKMKIDQFRKHIHECYDQTIVKNVTVNIFEAKVGQIAEKFFQSHGNLLRKLTIQQVHKQVKVFIRNLAVLAQLLVKCVIRKIKGQPTMKLGLTPMAAYSQAEVKQSILNHKLGNSPRNASQPVILKAGSNRCTWDPLPTDVPIPAYFNWADQGYVTPAVSQGRCGSCYLFATTAALESQYMIRTQVKTPVKFSEQALLNCVNQGCVGGNPVDVMEFFQQWGASLAGYVPYHAKVGSCRPDYRTALKANAYCHYSFPSETQMQRLLLRNGPAAVCMDAKNEDFAYLKDSPYTGQCGTDLNHAVLLIGWDEHNWILKNSWGQGWGRDGFGRMPRGGSNDNKCGIRADYTVPIVDSF